MKSRKERTNSESSSATCDCVQEIQENRLLHKTHTKGVIQARIDKMVKEIEKLELEELPTMLLIRALNRRSISKDLLSKGEKEFELEGYSTLDDFMKEQKSELASFSREERVKEHKATEFVIPNACDKFDKDVKFITKLIGRSEDEEESKENEDEL